MNIDYKKIILYNKEIRDLKIFTKKKLNIFLNNNKNNYYTNFKNNDSLKFKDYIITLLGYNNPFPNCHTNWFPWNRFLDVFKTIDINVNG